MLHSAHSSLLLSQIQLSWQRVIFGFISGFKGPSAAGTSGAGTSGAGTSGAGTSGAGTSGAGSSY
jgi:hypothetical protein